MARLDDSSWKGNDNSVAWDVICGVAFSGGEVVFSFPEQDGERGRFENERLFRGVRKRQRTHAIKTHRSDCFERIFNLVQTSLRREDCYITIVSTWRHFFKSGEAVEVWKWAFGFFGNRGDRGGASPLRSALLFDVPVLSVEQINSEMKMTF